MSLHFSFFRDHLFFIPDLNFGKKVLTGLILDNPYESQVFQVRTFLYFIISFLCSHVHNRRSQFLIISYLNISVTFF